MPRMRRRTARRADPALRTGRRALRSSDPVRKTGSVQTGDDMARGRFFSSRRIFAPRRQPRRRLMPVLALAMAGALLTGFAAGVYAGLSHPEFFGAGPQIAAAEF